MRLRARLLSLLVPVVAVPMLALGWAAYHQQRGALERRIEAEMATVSDQVATATEALVEHARANTALLARSPLLGRYLLTEDEESRYALLQPALLRLLKGYLRTHEDYDEIRVLGADGGEDARLGGRDPAPRLGPEFVETLRTRPGATHIALRHAAAGERWMLFVGRRVELVDRATEPISARARLRGFVVLGVSLRELHQRAMLTRLADRGHLFFTDGEGRVLFSPRTPRHGPRIGRDVLRRLGGGSARAVQAVEHLDEPYRMLARRILPDLVLFAAVPESDITGASHRLGWWIAGVTAAALVLGCALFYLVLKRTLVEPIRSLAVSARRIGHGDLDAVPELRRADEVGDLAQAFRDMGRDLRDSHARVHHLAYHDSLTGLPNRRLIGDHLRRALAEARASGGSLALLFVDVDDFKRINDSLGHESGDELLAQIAARITEELRPYDQVVRGEAQEATRTLARLGGDEFVVLLPRLEDQVQAAAVAERLGRALARPFHVAGRALRVSASIGIATAPRDGYDAEELVRRADIAMYQVKAQGKNGYQFHTEDMNRQVLRRMEVEHELRAAIERDEFVLHFQPQLAMHGARVVAVEALIRWQHPRHGLLAPARFIGAADESGLIEPVGAWVLREACAGAVGWTDAGGHPLRVAVNVSNRQISRAGFDTVVIDALERSGLAPERLELELTERSIMYARERGLMQLAAVKALGVSVAMDDFGTGYSSLAALRELPIDSLKVDRAFVRDLPANREDAAIAAAILEMGRGLDLRVVAEGIETHAQQAWFAERGCPVVQGFLHSPPLPAPALGAWLRDSRRRPA